MRRQLSKPFALAAVLHAAAASVALASGCERTPSSGLGGAAHAWILSDGGVAAFAKMNINIDGYARAYHPRNAAAGALIHLCNAGRVFLPDGTSYEGSESNATCTGRFMQDVARIGAAGWRNPAVGLINWYGVLGKGSASIGSRRVSSVEPVLQRGDSGFYVSPTALADDNVADPADQSRYVNPLRIPAAVAPKSVIAKGVALGSFGVAWHVDRKIAVPFVVGDQGPRIGEGSVALARLAAGLALKDDITRQERFAGQVDAPDVLWIFFKSEARRFDSRNEGATIDQAKAAFTAWGGEERLVDCAGQLRSNNP